MEIRLKTGLWDLARLLDLIRDEIRTRENKMLPSTTDQPDDIRNDGKNNHFFNDKSEYNPYTDSALTTIQRPQSLCIICRSPHWIDKCTVITGVNARREFIRKGGDVSYV